MTAIQDVGPAARLQKMDAADRLFRHHMFPDWGVGLWVKEEDTRRRLRFEDGEIRAFKQGHYHHLKPVDVDAIDVDEVFERIADDHEVARAEAHSAAARKDADPVMPFQRQVRLFLDLFPGGFAGDAYKAALREPAGRPKKAHVDIAQRLAAEKLSRPALDDAVSREAFGTVYQAALDVLAASALVSPKKGYRLLEGFTEEHQRTFALALRDLLWGPDRFRVRFAAWLDALGGLGVQADWPLATVFLGLVHPDKHVVVKRRVYELQAREVKPGTTLRKKPDARSYRRARRVAKATRRKLLDAGLPVADYLDVRAFIWQTLRPAGQRRAEELSS